MNIIHVVGTGTIGLPLIGLLLRHKKQLQIDEVSFHKNTPLKEDWSGIKQLIDGGAVLCSWEDKFDEFEKLGVRPVHGRHAAVERASVVIDCTPKGVGKVNKLKYYSQYQHKDKSKGFIAQGSESGFGFPYAYKINDDALTNKLEQFIQVVSCNTHNLSCIYKSLHDAELEILTSDFLCMRRANDISQNSDMVGGVEVGRHKDEIFGTHHAKDAHSLLCTLGIDANIFTSECKIPTQYMHCLYFNICLENNAQGMSVNDVVDMFRKNKMISISEKTTSNQIFSFGRDYGHFGRLLTQTVISKPTLSLTEYFDVYDLRGFAFTPQDGNSLISTVAATLWFLNDKNWSKVYKKMQAFDDYLFGEV